MPAADAFTEALSKGPVYAALAALAGGFVVSLTPCVYPMVAVTVSVFGAREAKSRWEGAALSAAFVLGIVAMFVPLGVAAGLSGSIFGSVLQNRWVVVGMAVLFLALAASLFGAYELALPGAVTNRLATFGGIGYRGAFFLGLACGLIASPCTGAGAHGHPRLDREDQERGARGARDGRLLARTRGAVLRRGHICRAVAEERALDGARQIAARHRAGGGGALLFELGLSGARRRGSSRHAALGGRGAWPWSSAFCSAPCTANSRIR